MSGIRRSLEAVVFRSGVWGEQQVSTHVTSGSARSAIAAGVKLANRKTKALIPCDMNVYIHNMYIYTYNVYIICRYISKDVTRAD